MFPKMIFAAVALCVFSPVSARADNAVICSETAKIVQTAVVQRAAGMQAKTIKRGMTEGANRVGEPFVPMVSPLVDWVFIIQQREVDAPGAAQAITDTYRKECMGFDP